MNPNIVKEVSVQELHQMQQNQEDFQLIDVREADELKICNINGEHIPLGALDINTEKISRDKKVVVHCKSGRRSQMAILFLQQQHGFENLYNLAGGIMAYARDIDTSLVGY